MAATASLTDTARSGLSRRAARGSHDRDLANEILDEALVCHLGVVTGHGPLVLPMTFARIDDDLYLHGAPANGVLGAAVGSDVCVSVTLLDGLVLARSAFHHSMNYRSVVLFATAAEVTDPGEKLAASLALVDRMSPGRASRCRPPTTAELRATAVVRVPIREGSVKVRTGGPADDEADLDLDHWAGVIPVSVSLGEPVAC